MQNRMESININISIWRSISINSNWQFISELGLFSDKTMLLQQLQYVALHWAVNTFKKSASLRFNFKIPPWNSACCCLFVWNQNLSFFFFFIRNIRTYYISLNYIYLILFIMQGQIKHGLRRNILHKHKACVCLYTLMTCSHPKDSLSLLGSCTEMEKSICDL